MKRLPRLLAAVFAAMLLLPAIAAHAGNPWQRKSDWLMATPAPHPSAMPQPVPTNSGAHAGASSLVPPYAPGANPAGEAVPDVPVVTDTGRVSPSASIPAVDGITTDHVLTPGQVAYHATRDTSYIDPTSWSVTVYKHRHELDVYYKGHFFKRYHSVSGRSFEPGAKSWEGDRRTPEGIYTIVEKHPSRRFQWFLKLSYPNDDDRARYEQMCSDHLVPISDGHPVGLGDRIGIHGTDKPILNSGNINWTTGCISVDKADIVELYKLLPVGTLVVIKP